MKGLKTGGRQKGTPNKVTTEVRELLADLAYGIMDNVMQNIDNLTLEQSIAFLPKILPYVAPKIKAKTEKDQQDVACEHVKSLLSLAQIVSDLDQGQQPDTNPEEEQFNDNGQNPQSYVSSDSDATSDNPDFSDYSEKPDYPNQSNNSDPSDNPDFSDYSDNPDYPNPSNNSDPSDSSDSTVHSGNSASALKTTPKRPAPRSPFYKALNTRKTHNKRHKRR